MSFQNIGLNIIPGDIKHEHHQNHLFTKEKSRSAESRPKMLNVFQQPELEGLADIVNQNLIENANEYSIEAKLYSLKRLVVQIIDTNT